MPERAWTRRAVVAVAALVVGAAVPVVGERVALSQLQERGLSWGAVHRSTSAWGVDDVAREGVSVDQLRVPLGWPLQVQLRGVAVDVEQLGGAGRAQLGGGGGGGLPLYLDDVTLRAGTWVLGEGLSGRRDAAGLVLEGPGTVLRVAGGRVSLEATRPSPLAELRGELSLSAVLAADGGLDVSVVGEGLSLRHPLLASRPLLLDTVRAELTRSGDQLVGDLYVGELALGVAVGCEPDCALTLTLAQTPASEALAPLAPLVPEVDRARRIDGTVAAALTVAQRSGEWHVTDASLDLAELAVDGAVQDLDGLNYGRFAYRVRDAEGEPRVRETGEGTPDWVALQQVSPWVIEAILASEDAAFRRHRGYDPAQIREALAADLEAGGVVRGGSTLSQQLAKNLFLTGDRTLVRKVREILLAVELDRVLGKSRLLELYVNVVEWGPEVHGLRQACDRYFLKQPGRIQPHEAAFLAAILPAPRTFYDDWYVAGRAGRYKVGSVLTNMADLGAMSHRQAQHWSQQPLRFVPPPR